MKYVSELRHFFVHSSEEIITLPVDDKDAGMFRSVSGEQELTILRLGHFYASE